MGIGDCGLGSGDWGVGPMPNPHSPPAQTHTHNPPFIKK